MNEQQVIFAINEYGDTVKRICYLYMKNHADTEDVFQNVFCKYFLHKEEFADKDHEKAWLIRVAINLCKDNLKSFFKSKTISFDQLKKDSDLKTEEKEDYSYVRQAVMELPQKYRNVIYLYYFEDYSAKEIGTILGKSENTIYTQLARGRKMLENIIGGDIL